MNITHKRVYEQHLCVPLFAKNAGMAMGKRVKSLREDHGWTLEQLAARSGVKATTISMLEQRDSKKNKDAGKLADALGVTLLYLLEGKDSVVEKAITEEESELLQLWKHIESTEREAFLRQLRGKVAEYRRVAEHLAKIGVNLNAPPDHQFPFKVKAVKKG